MRLACYVTDPGPFLAVVRRELLARHVAELLDRGFLAFVREQRIEDLSAPRLGCYRVEIQSFSSSESFQV